jgi:hypothetical protein
LALPCAATDYSTTNRDSLGHFWKAAEEKIRPVTVLSFGDSMADSYRSPTYYLMRKFEDRLGVAGYSLNNYRNTLMIQWSNGTAVVPDSATWFTQHLSVPPGGTVWWENQVSAGGVVCDQAGIFYVRQPQGGTIMLSISTNTGPWSPRLMLDGYSPTPIGAYTNVNLALNPHRIRVDGISGTNYIIGPQLLMVHTNGLQVAFMDQPGIPLYAVTNVPISIRGPIFAALKPDLLIWHMKEPVEPLPSSLAECESWWSNAYPECDVLYIGTPWIATDTTSTFTLDQNQIVRREALSHNRAYVDLMQPGINYDWRNSNGLILSDGVHLSHAGGQWGAAIMWNDLGFFALGLPRQLSLELTGGLAHVSFPTAPGATYTVQSSLDLHDWLPELTTPGTGSSYSTNLTLTHPRSYYRLRLTP